MNPICSFSIVTTPSSASYLDRISSKQAGRPFRLKVHYSRLLLGRPTNRCQGGLNLQFLQSANATSSSLILFDLTVEQLDLTEDQDAEQNDQDAGEDDQDVDDHSPLFP